MASNNKPSTASPLYRSANMLPQIKREPLPPDSKLYTTERLASFRKPRDLTLGGSLMKVPTIRPNLQQNNKKVVWTPNLNVTRNKNVDVKTSRDTSIASTRGRGRGRGGAGAARSDRGKASGPASKTPRNTIVASSGLFSEGAGDGTTKRLYRSFRGANDDATPSSLRRPTLSSKREKVDPQVEQKHISEIYDLDLTEEDGVDSSAINDFFSPINLCRAKPEIKLEERINGMEIKEETNDRSNVRLKYPESMGEFVDRTEPQLFLMQLPDALPGHGTESEPADSAETQDPAQPQENLCTMHNLEEGKIGRLVRYRSGKMKLLLGDSKFDIDLGIDPNLLQEVISTQINKSERNGKVINLGQINAKVNAVPDWEFMLNNIADKKS